MRKKRPANIKVAQNLDEFSTLIEKSGISHIDLEPQPVRKLLKSFSFLKDKRQKHKIHYTIQALLIIVLLAKVTSRNANCCEIAGFAKSHLPLLKEADVLKDSQSPSHDTIQRFIESLDVTWIRSKLTALKEFYKKIQRILGLQGKYIHLALDGQEFRGSGRSKNSKSPKRNIATLNFYYSSFGVCLYSIPIDLKENEIPVAQRALLHFLLKGTVVTADALHTQRKTLQIIRNNGGHYVIAAKENQKSLYLEMQTSFEKKKPKHSKQYYYERGDRKFWVIVLDDDYIGEEWVDQKLYIKMVSSTTGKEAEPMYFISSLSDHIAALEAIELRWTIENKHHKSKDVYLSQDKYTSTKEEAVEGMAYINNLTLGIIELMQIIMREERTFTMFQHFSANPLDLFCKAMEIINHPDKFIKLLKEKLALKNCS